MRVGEWAARTTDTPKRSVFGNYRAEDAPAAARATLPAASRVTPAAAIETSAPLQAAIDLAMARSFIYRFLAKAYEDPTPESWQMADATAARDLTCASAAADVICAASR